MKKSHNSTGLAFTYNEPTIWGEWVIELASLAKENDLISVMVTNGFITHEAVKDIYPLIDAANIDLKSFTDNFYYKVTLSHIQPVLDAILWIKNEGTWIELTNLIIPGQNDSPKEIKELTEWVYNYCGDDTPVHFTAFHPDYRMTDIPPTPFSTLQMAYDTAKETGLKYVYTGNIADDRTASTYCPSCSEMLVQRSWYDVKITGLDGNKCSNCGYEIKGIF
jgi:pyruvate formate lyase activating enzyme